MAHQVKPPSSSPEDLLLHTFESLEELEAYPLFKHQVSVVVNSYDRTIEMLVQSQQKGLATQAMHELGNIMYHSGNTRYLK